jgi:hypothetical protein
MKRITRSEYKSIQKNLFLLTKFGGSQLVLNDIQALFSKSAEDNLFSTLFENQEAFSLWRNEEDNLCIRVISDETIMFHSLATNLDVASTILKGETVYMTDQTQLVSYVRLMEIVENVHKEIVKLEALKPINW